MNEHISGDFSEFGVIGLGHMGSDFADNLIVDGYQVTVYDLNEKHIAALVAKGATGAAGLRDMAGCEAVLTSLPDDHALTEVALGEGGLIHVLTPGAIHISMSTVSPGLSRRLAQQHGLTGQGYVAAPVLGNPDLAQARKLFILLGLACHRQWRGFRQCSNGLGSASLCSETMLAAPIS